MADAASLLNIIRAQQKEFRKLIRMAEQDRENEDNYLADYVLSKTEKFNDKIENLLEEATKNG